MPKFDKLDIKANKVSNIMMMISGAASPMVYKTRKTTYQYITKTEKTMDSR